MGHGIISRRGGRKGIKILHASKSSGMAVYANELKALYTLPANYDLGTMVAYISMGINHEATIKPGEVFDTGSDTTPTWFQFLFSGRSLAVRNVKPVAGNLNTGAFILAVACNEL